MKAIIVGVALLIIGCIGLSRDASALQATTNRWTQASPVVQSSVVSIPAEDVTCPTYIQDVLVGSEVQTRRTCLYRGERMRFGIYTEGNLQRAVVAFAHDSRMSVLKDVCVSAVCRYSADQDILVMQSYSRQTGRELVIYSHVSQRLKRVVLPGSGEVVYELDTSMPDYTLKNDAGLSVDPGAYALSDNGKWLAVELRNRGTALVDTTTFTVRHIATVGYGYGAGMDPTEELAVSNDGQSVAVVGMNVGFVVIDIVPGCGQELVGYLSPQPGVIGCQSTDLGIGNTFPNFFSAHRPEFSPSGESLKVTVLLRSEPVRSVVFGVAGSDPVVSIGMLSLGDSFASGLGENDERFYLEHTNSGVDDCSVSRRSYPFLLAATMGIAGSNSKSVACAGAQIVDVTSVTKNYYGQNNRLRPQTGEISETGVEQSKQQALTDFWPGRAAQAAFVKKYSPSVLTVGVGGNDIGLMGKLRVCAMPGTCEWAVGEGRQKTAGEINGLFDRLATLYAELAQASPGSRIYAVGYPDIINPEGVCDPLTALLFDAVERVYMRESLHYLNQVIAAAAMKSGITYLDIENSFAGKKLCDSLVSPAMNGVKVGDDAAPISALPQLRIISAGSFHPKPVGHALISTSITNHYSALSSYEACSDGVRICPVSTAAPIADEYWRTSEIQSAPRAYFEEFARFVTHSSRHLQLSLPAFSLLTGSQVRVELRSDEVLLGTTTANHSGGLEMDVTIPELTTSGFHTLHVFGTSPSGDSIDIYQFVSVDDEGEVRVTDPENAVTDGGNSLANLSAGGSPVTTQLAIIGTTETPLQVQTDDAAVLGSDSQSSAIASGASTPEVQPMNGVKKSIVRSLPDLGWIYIWVIAALVAIIAIPLILLQRRWAKRSSSV